MWNIGTQLDLKYLFSSSSIVDVLFKIDKDGSMDILYSDRAMEVATAVIHAFGQYLTVSLCFIITTSALCHTQQQQQIARVGVRAAFAATMADNNDLNHSERELVVGEHWKEPVISE
ncbi:hypothetical protein TNCV_3310601 [Trichonephila clavipes]|nr:hypothetical protein TNCV_3310601 [Trichonephila clavipes]